MTNAVDPARLTWQVPPGPGGGTGGMAIEMALAIARSAAKLFRDFFPDLADLSVLDYNAICSAYFNADGWLAIRLKYDRSLAIPVGPTMEPTDQHYVMCKITGSVWFEPDVVSRTLGQDWVSVDAFTYVGPYHGNNVSWPDIERHFTWWINHQILPHATQLNKTRVMRALPAAPAYNLKSIYEAVWVLECEQDTVQGTAFCVAGIGLVTCDHSLGAATHAFHYSNPSVKYPIRVVRHHEVIDLAVLAFEGERGALRAADPGGLQVMDHLLVVGHPNYRLGDSPMVSPGIVVGFRPKSGVRRIVTNAPIVAGTSGGPVLNRDGLVIGVAVTGSDNFASATETEDHTIIPIDALDLV